MSEAQVALLVAIVSSIFTAGGFYVWTKSSIASLRKEVAENKLAAAHDLNGARRELEKDMDQMRLNLYRDINGLGKRGRKNQESADRRYHNLCMAAMIAAPPSKESELAGLLREGR